MKFNVYYSGDRVSTLTIEAEDQRDAAKQFFLERPQSEDRKIRVETTGWGKLSIEEFQSSEFVGDTTGASLVNVPRQVSSEPEPPIPALATFFYILAALQFIGGLVLCNLLWPGESEPYIVYIPAITWLTAGVISGALFLAVANILTYLCQIRDSLLSGTTTRRLPLSLTRA